MGTVSARAVVRIIEAAGTAGVPREMLMRVAGLSESAARDPDARVASTTEIAIWQLISRQVRDPGFGVRSGAAFRVRDAGLLGYVVAFTPTLHDALLALERYIRVFSEAVTIKVDGADVWLATPASAHGLEPVPLAQDYRLAAVVSAARELTGVDLVPTDVHFAYAQPSGILPHREFFRTRMQFSRTAARVRFREADLRLATRRRDPDLARHLGKYADLVLASLIHGETLRHKVRAVIWARAPLGGSALGEVARTMGMAPRTLQRQLHEEGSSLRKELDEVRKAAAMAVLANPDVAIDDVAFLLGYAEPSAFYRSFKRWTDRTPQEFRRLSA